MPKTINWEQYSPNGGGDQAVRELIRAIVGMHTSFSDGVWLWRGQSNGDYGLQPSMHSRVLAASGIANNEASVAAATQQLIERARRAKLDELDGIRLPDLALLAHLQHHGAATPLLDVTVDPLVALWMVAFSAPDAPDTDDDKAGKIFGIRRPPDSARLESFDSREYRSISASMSDPIYWYQPPDVSERLRIQRGSFLVGAMTTDDGDRSTLDFGKTAPTGWLEKRIAQIGNVGSPTKSDTDVIVFKVPKNAKSPLRRWLLDRAGLTPRTVYPTPWHRPFLDEFCAAHGRRSPLTDIDSP